MNEKTFERSKDRDYREDLRNEFLRRSRRHQHYSLRAFARDLSMSPSRLSEVLNLKSHISLRTAWKITSQLELNEVEQKKWFAKVQMMASRSASLRKSAASEFQKMSLTPKVRKISNQEFSPLADWYSLAILELAADGKLTNNDKKWSMALGIDLFVYRQALRKLVDAQYIYLRGIKYLTQDRSHLAGDQGPSRDVRNFHEQVLKQAVEKLHRINPRLRDFNARYISLTESQYASLKELIREFLHKTLEKSSGGAANSEVYALAVQLFPLTQIQLTDFRKGDSK